MRRRENMLTIRFTKLVGCCVPIQQATLGVNNE